MASFNLVVLIGNLVSAPELKSTINNVNICSFKIAVNRQTTQEDKPSVDFIEIITWRKTAEFVCKYFKKGDPILVRGALQTNSYIDKNNQKRYNTYVNAEEVSFIAKKSSGGPELPDLPDIEEE
jgi:single-strand DNA-binding protein